MASTCRWCLGESPQGALACARCHNPLSDEPPTAARCPAHPAVPAPTPCGRCGTFRCGQCLTLRGQDWRCPACLALEGRLPWDDRRTLGTLTAWWRTSLQLIASPQDTLARARADSPVQESLLFAALSCLAGFGTTVVLYAFFGAAAVALTGAGGLPDLPSALDARTAALVAPLVMAGLFGLVMVSQLVGVLFLAWLDHLALRLLEVEPRPYAVTVRANALALAPYLVGLVPLCGLYVFPLWSFVLRVLAVRTLQRTTLGRAALAVVLPTLLLCGLCGGFYALLVGWAAATGMGR